MINVNVCNYMESLGLSAVGRQNRYVYMETSPFTNALLNIKYIISRDGELAGSEYFNEIGSAENSKLFINKYPLSLGFMVSDNVLDFTVRNQFPYNAQNDIFRKMTDLPYNLFDIEKKRIERGKDKLSWSIRMEKNGTLFAYTDGYNTSNLTISNGEQRYKYNNTYAAILNAGTYKKDDFVTFDFELRDGDVQDITLYLAYMNKDVFEMGYSKLCDEQMEITEFSSTKIRGNVNALKDGILYTSIPYEEGWTATVNGKAAEIIPIAQAMCGLKLESGNHTVSFFYEPQGYSEGFILSVIAIWCFLVICFRKNR